MKPKEAKELLDCSYTTLHNYVRQNKLKANKNPTNGFLEFDDDSVFELSKYRLKNRGNRIVVIMNGKIFTYNVSDRKLLETIQFIGS